MRSAQVQRSNAAHATDVDGVDDGRGVVDGRGLSVAVRRLAAAPVPPGLPSAMAPTLRALLQLAAWRL